VTEAPIVTETDFEVMTVILKYLVGMIGNEIGSTLQNLELDVVDQDLNSSRDDI
jgi:hypothetical protein